jgi:hypothetical protein
MLFGNPSEEKGVEEMGYFRQKSQNYYKKNLICKNQKTRPNRAPKLATTGDYANFLPFFKEPCNFGAWH